MMLGNRQPARNTVGCARKGEYDFVNARIEQRVQEDECLADVIFEISARPLDGLGHISVSGKANGRANPEAFNCFRHERPVADIAHDQWFPFHCPPMTDAQIIEDNRIVAGCCKSFAGVTADITGSARDQDVHSHGRFPQTMNSDFGFPLQSRLWCVALNSRKHHATLITGSRPITEIQQRFSGNPFLAPRSTSCSSGKLSP